MTSKNLFWSAFLHTPTVTLIEAVQDHTKVHQGDKPLGLELKILLS